MEDDVYHQRVLSLFKEISAEGEALVLSQSVLGELATFINRKEGPKTASEKTMRIINSKSWAIITAKETELRQALASLEKFGFSSYTDALNLAIMHSRGIRKIASFDSEFDKVPGIERIF